LQELIVDDVGPAAHFSIKSDRASFTWLISLMPNGYVSLIPTLPCFPYADLDVVIKPNFLGYVVIMSKTFFRMLPLCRIFLAVLA